LKEELGGVEEGVGDIIDGEEEEEGGLEVAVETFFDGNHFRELAGGCAGRRRCWDER
jgi:hypothetical protein